MVLEEARGEDAAVVEQNFFDTDVAGRREQHELLCAVVQNIGAPRERVEVVLEERLFLESSVL